jgi:hypothetical protein
MECADIPYNAIRKARSLSEARQNIINEQPGDSSSKAYHSQQFDVDFRGIDFSFALP